MARIRSIKPDFWTDEKIVELSPFSRLLFIGLWNFCDDAGRMQYSTKKIKMQIFPGDTVDVSELLGEIRRENLITIYEVENISYLQVNGFTKHQKIDKRTASKLPKPPESPRLSPSDQGTDQGRDQGKGGEGSGSKPAPAAKHSSEPEPKLSTIPKELEPDPDPPINPPTGTDAVSTRALELTIMLRKRGASLQASDPNVRKWAQSGVSDAQALAALDTATQRRADKCSTQPINSGYLDSILTSSEDPNPDKPRKRSGPPWWSSNELMIAKANEIGVKPPKPGESWETFRGRINAELAKSESTA